MGGETGRETYSAAKLHEKLDEALGNIEDARRLVGRVVPDAAREWAEGHGLEVKESEFAPINQLYLIGAMPVFDSLPMDWYTDE